MSFTSHPGVASNISTSTLIYGDLGVYLAYDDVQGGVFACVHFRQRCYVLFFLHSFNLLPGSSYGPAAQVTARMLEQLSGSAGSAPTHAIHIGDISYARGYSYIWEYFMNQVRELMMELLWFGNFFPALTDHAFGLKCPVHGRNRQPCQLMEKCLDYLLRFDCLACPGIRLQWLWSGMGANLGSIWCRLRYYYTS
jgi:hypothetical protein